MLHEETERHISGLSDPELLEYVLMGLRLYEQEAVEFARIELYSRRITEETLAEYRPAIVAKVAAYDEQTQEAEVVPNVQGRSASGSAILCQKCGCEVPNKYVEYYQNIGLFIIRKSKMYKGCFCKLCNRTIFWKTTLTTFFFGWWGTKSFFITLAFLIQNLITFIRTIPLRAAPVNWEPPRIDGAVLAAVGPHIEQIAEQLNAGGNAADIAKEIAEKTTATPGQVWCFIQTMLKNQNAAPTDVRSPVTTETL